MSADPSDPSSKVDLERRRVPLQRKISLKFKEFRGFITEYSSNLSMGGMFIRTTSPKPVGTIFDFELSLTDDFKLVQGIGEVIWVREVDDGAERPAGMGVRFLDLSAESRRLIQRIVEEQVAHGGTPFELEPPGFPPPPLRPAAGAATRAGGQSAVFHATAAPVSPTPPPPARPGARPAAGTAAPARPTARPPSPPMPRPPAAAVPPLPVTPTALPSAPPARPRVPAAGDGALPDTHRTHADVLPDLTESWEGEALEGFSLEDAADAVEISGAIVEPPTQSAALADIHEDATLLQGARAPLSAAGPSARSPWVPPVPAAAASQPPTVIRGRGLPSGFDEVARAFSEAGRAADPQSETVRLTPLAVPPAPKPVVIAPPAAVDPVPQPAPRPASIARPSAPRQRVRRRRSPMLPLLAALVLALVAGAGVVYLWFPELLPEWARAPRLGEGGAPTPAASTAPAPGAAAPLSAGASPTAAAVPAAPSAAGGEAGGNPASPSPPDVAAAAPSSSAGAPPPTRPAGGPRQDRNAAVSTSRFTSIEEIWGQRTAAGTVVSIVTNGVVPLDAFSHFRLEGPNPREVIRLRDVDDSYRRSTIAVGTGEVKQVRLGYHAKPGGRELHIVVDVNSPRVQLIRATPVDNRIELLFAVQ